jgi:anti-sigma B factor antagonist
MSQMKIRHHDGVPIITVDEDLDAANAPELQRLAAAALGPDALSLVIDLSGARYVDSAGIDVLLRLRDRLDRRRAELILVIPEASQLHRLFAMVGMPEATAIHPSTEDALTALLFRDA